MGENRICGKYIAAMRDAQPSAALENRAGHGGKFKRRQDTQGLGSPRNAPPKRHFLTPLRAREPLYAEAFQSHTSATVRERCCGRYPLVRPPTEIIPLERSARVNRAARSPISARPRQTGETQCSTRPTRIGPNRPPSQPAFARRLARLPPRSRLGVARRRSPSRQHGETFTRTKE